MICVQNSRYAKKGVRTIDDRNHQDTVENFLEILDLAEEDLEELVATLQSQELVGLLGVEEHPLREHTNEEVAEELQSVIDELRREFKDTNTKLELLTVYTEHAGQYFGAEEDLESDAKEWEQAPASIMTSVAQSFAIRDEIAKHGDRPLKEDVWEFYAELHRQQTLWEAATAAIGWFLENPNAAISYLNTLLTQMPTLLDQIQEIEQESEAVSAEEIIRYYRGTGPLLEDALPPLVLLKREVRNNDTDKPVDDSSLSNLLEEVQNTPRIGQIVRHVDPNIRNAVSHGGVSGFDIDQLNQRYRFRYERGDSIESMELGFEQFRRQTKFAMIEAMTLFLIPVELPMMAILWEFHQPTDQLPEDS